MKLVIAIFVLLLPAFCSAQKEAEIKNWLEQNTLSFKDDSLFLAPLKYEKLTDYLEGKRIVALGEPTHGSKQAQLLRLQLFKFLVEHKGFRTIALEAVDNSGVVNDYVLHGKGTSSDVVKSMGMWMLGTEETEQLVSWMKDYNSSHEEKIRFFGADLNYKFNVKHLQDSLTDVSGINIDLIDSISFFNEKYMGKKDDPPKEPMKQLKVLVDELYANVLDHKKAIEVKASKDYYNFLVYTIKTHQQVVDLYILGKSAPRHYRDSCMATNVGFILQHLNNGANVFYGAHNGHIQYDYHLSTRTTGSFLKEQYNEEFYSVGVEFGSHTFRSLIWSSKNKKYLMNINTIPGYKKKSLGDILQNLNEESFYIDFDSSAKGEIYNVLFSKFRPVLYVGWLFSPGHENDFYIKNKFSSLYDGLFYYKSSSETTLIDNKNPF